MPNPPRDGVRARASTPTARDVQRELARARGARRLLPWAFVTAAGGGAIALAAGGGVRAAAALGAIGLLFAVFLWVTSIPRCPICGARLSEKKRRPDPHRDAGPAVVDAPASCPRCRTRFEP